MIGFNKPYLTGKETEYIQKVFQSQKLSGNGEFTQKCQRFIEERFGIKKCLLTSSATDALEMIALLLDIKAGDEVIIPSYTFVSTANAFVLRGAQIVFADSCEDNPNINPDLLEPLITPRTKAIVVVHYAGSCCNMDKVVELTEKHKLFLVEDAAQAINSFYKNRPLGSLGHLACFSFHETKNISSGEGGALLINDDRFIKRAEIIWEKGTNRAAFYRGEIDKYTWVDVGSSFLPSEITAALLWAQLEKLDEILSKRLELWNYYFSNLRNSSARMSLPVVTADVVHNGHIFYLLANSESERDELIDFLNHNGVNAIFHYLPLHLSQFGKTTGQISDRASVPYAEQYAKTLLRLPIYHELSLASIDKIVKLIIEFFYIRNTLS